MPQVERRTETAARIFLAATCDVGDTWHDRDMTADAFDPTAPSRDTFAEATELLRSLTGRPDAEFHQGQFEAIHALVDQGRRALVVQRTGWGKSAVYFVATGLLRRRACFGGSLTRLVRFSVCVESA